MTIVQSTFGNFSKNAVIGPPLADFDFALEEAVQPYRAHEPAVSRRSPNVFNHPNFGNITPIFSGSKYRDPITMEIGVARNGSAGRSPIRRRPRDRSSLPCGSRSSAAPARLFAHSAARAPQCTHCKNWFELGLHRDRSWRSSLVQRLEPRRDRDFLERLMISATVTSRLLRIPV